MKLGSWLCAAALLPMLAAGCPGDDDEGSTSDTSQDGGSSQGQDAGAGGGGAGSSGGSAVEVPPSCNWQTPGGELADAFFRIGATTCRLCSETDRHRSNCIEAPVADNAINCIRAAVCADETLTGPAKRMVGCLDNRHATCNQEAEKSCDDGCLAFSAGDAHRRCNSDPNLGAAMAKCGIDLTTSGMR